MQLLDAPLIVAAEALRRHGVHALAALFVRGRHAEDVGPQRPRVVGRARVRRLRQQLELVHGQRALPMHGAEAVGAGVAAADNHDALAFRADELGVRDRVPFHALVRQREVLHREVNALQLAPGHRQIARQPRAAREHDRVEFGLQLIERHVDADVHARAEVARLPAPSATAGGSGTSSPS